MAAAGPIKTVALRPGRLEVVRLVVGYSECQKFIPIGAIRKSPSSPFRNRGWGDFVLSHTPSKRNAILTYALLYSHT